MFRFHCICCQHSFILGEEVLGTIWHCPMTNQPIHLSRKMARQLSEAEWLAWSEPGELLPYLGSRVGVRKRRLLMCALYGVTEELLDKGGGQSAVQAARQALRDWPFGAPTQGSAADKKRYCDLLRDICGNLFYVVRVDPAWLAWNEATVRRLARGIDSAGAFDRLPILADALEEAGCADRILLEHCRRPDGHVRGCWVVDLLRGAM
jgi:hypothetical protein